MERLLRLFILLYIQNSKLNRDDISDLLGVNVRQVNNYINSINCVLVESGIYFEVKYSKRYNAYVIIDMLKES